MINDSLVKKHPFLLCIQLVMTEFYIISNMYILKLHLLTISHNQDTVLEAIFFFLNKIKWTIYVFTILGYPSFITHKVDWYSTLTWPDGELNRMGIVQGRSEYERKMDNQYRRNNILGSSLSARPNQCNLQFWKLIVATHIVTVENPCIFYTRYSKPFIQRSCTKQDLSMKEKWITSIDKKKTSLGHHCQQAKAK